MTDSAGWALVVLIVAAISRVMLGVAVGEHRARRDHCLALGADGFQMDGRRIVCTRTVPLEPEGQ